MSKQIPHDVDFSEARIRSCNIGWAIVDGYLDGLEASAHELLEDPEYKKRFDAMRQYCNRMLYGCDECNMIDCKVIIYQDNE